MDIELRLYQQDVYDKIIDKLVNRVKRVCVALPTGSGKSVIIGKLANELKGRTLILTHRIEILQQNSDWLDDCGILAARINTVEYDSNIAIAMVQTIFARIKKYGIDYIGEFDNIILDEVQILIFEKVFEQYNYKRLIGFTATPVIMKKLYTTIDGIEYVEPYTLSLMFDELVQGVDTQDLIDLDFLVQERNIVLKLPDFEKLTVSENAPDGYTRESILEVYKNYASLEILQQSYFDYCKGKKTLLFNSNTEVNEFVYEHFHQLGLNVKMYDSVNETDINPATGRKFTRKQIIEWFKNEKDAILINTNVFTTGFDVTDVECIIVNRATKSLALWLQMVGRGSRITDIIFKDSFTVIDLGQNIHEHGIWSARRDWNDYFFSSGMKLKNKVDLFQTWECQECGALNLMGTLICEECGAEKILVKTEDNRKLKEGELQIIGDVVYPRAKSIIAYTERLNESSHFAFKLLETKIIELFVFTKVDDKFYKKNRERFLKRIKQIYNGIYFAIIKSELRGRRRKYETRFNTIKTKIDKMYNYEERTDI